MTDSPFCEFKIIPFITTKPCTVILPYILLSVVSVKINSLQIMSLICLKLTISG